MDAGDYFGMPFTSISNLLPYTDRKALKYAFTYSIAFVFVAAVLTLAAVIFLVFQVFLRPLIWSIVIGTCLFPCKFVLTTSSRDYLRDQKTKGVPYCLSLILAPFHFIQTSADVFFNTLRDVLTPVVVTLISTGVFLLFQEFGVFASLGLQLTNFYSFLGKLLSFVSSIISVKLVLLFAGTHLVVVLTGITKLTLSQISRVTSCLWFLFFVSITSWFGYLQPVVCTASLVLMLILNLYNSTQRQNGERSGNNSSGHGEISISTGLPRRLSLLLGPYPPGKIRKPASGAERIGEEDQADVSVSSTVVQRCFVGLGLAHFSIAFWTRTWVMQITLLVGFLCLLVYLASRVHLTEKLSHLWNLVYSLPSRSQTAGDTSSSAPQNLKDILVPPVLKTTCQQALRYEKGLYDLADGYLDYLVSFTLIGLMVLAVLLLTYFLLIQVHNESLHLISLTTSVINSTVHSRTFSWLPDEKQINRTMRFGLANLHQFGEDFIRSKLDLISHRSTAERAALEAQLLSVWENVCVQLFQGTSSGAAESTEERGTILSQLSASGNLSLAAFRGHFRRVFHSIGGFDMTSIVAYFRENVDTVINILNSLWHVLSVHASVLFSVLNATTSVLLVGGTVMLNFSLSFLIFISALFYLLAASGSSYLPVEFVVSLTPQASEASPLVLSFYSSVESAIASVLITTLKRTVFYGMYTVLTHSLFGLDIVVLPSITATILGAIPIVSPYWATLPGVIELLFVRGSYWLTLLLFGLHLLPHFFLDTALYSEIKGAGHPYLTGLSIAGGLYYFGADGAFIGPILLCFLLVGVNLYRCFLTSEVTSHQPISPHPTTIFMSHSKPTTLPSLPFSNFVTSRRLRRPYAVPRSVSEELLSEASRYQGSC